MDLQITKIIFDIIKKTIKDDNENQANIDIVDALSLETSLAQINISSLLFIKIIANIELQLKIEFEYEMLDMNHFDNISLLVSYVEKKVKGNSVTQ